MRTNGIFYYIRQKGFKIIEVNSGSNMGLNPHGCAIAAAINITGGLVIKKIVCPCGSLWVSDTAAALLPLPAPSAYDNHTGTSTFANASTSNFPSPRIARQVARRNWVSKKRKQGTLALRKQGTKQGTLALCHRCLFLVQYRQIYLVRSSLDYDSVVLLKPFISPR